MSETGAEGNVISRAIKKILGTKQTPTSTTISPTPIQQPEWLRRQQPIGQAAVERAALSQTLQQVLPKAEEPSVSHQSKTSIITVEGTPKIINDALTAPLKAQTKVEQRSTKFEETKKYIKDMIP